MNCCYIEILVSLVSFGVALYFLFVKPRARTPFFAAWAVGMLCSVILEIVNERLFAGQGTVYTDVLLPFRPFQFPVAIVLLTGLYAASLGCISHRVSLLVAPRHIVVRFAIVVGATAILNLASLGIEHAGIAVGWWRHQRAADLSRIYGPIYLFYSAAALPAALVFTAVERWRRTS